MQSQIPDSSSEAPRELRNKWRWHDDDPMPWRRRQIRGLVQILNRFNNGFPSRVVHRLSRERIRNPFVAPGHKLALVLGCEFVLRHIHINQQRS
jgi:hypothetical protein